MVKKKDSKDKKTTSKKTPDALDIVRKAIEKKYGTNVVMKAEDMIEEYKAISTGCIGLDSLLGIGGIPLGTIAEIYGPPSSGKSTLAMNIMAQAQMSGLKCLLIDAERAYDAKLYAAMGVNLEDLIIARSLTGEANLDIAETYIKANLVDVVVIDSVTGLIPTAEAEEGMDKVQMGLHARMMSKALRRLTPLAGETNTLIIFINQTRNKINAYGDPETTSGGMAIPFFATTRIKVTGGEYSGSRIKDDDGIVIGHQTTFEIKKTRKAKPFTKAVIPLIYGEGYDLCWETLTLAVDYGIIDKSGAWYSYQDKKIGQGEVNARTYLRDNDDVYFEIRNKIIGILGLADFYERNS